MNTLSPEAARRLYLSYFPKNQRSGAANHMLEAVRAGRNNADQIVGYALERARRKATWSEYAGLILILAEMDPAALYAGAQWALWWESVALELRLE